jgi:hypothetical protein
VRRTVPVAATIVAGELERLGYEVPRRAEPGLKEVWWEV